MDKRGKKRNIESFDLAQDRYRTRNVEFRIRLKHYRWWKILQRFRTHFQGLISVKKSFFLNFLLDFLILNVYNGFLWSSVKEEKYQERMAGLPETLSHEEISISALGPGQGMGAEAVRKCARRNGK